MTAIDGIVKPKKPSHISVPSVKREAAGGGERIDSYKLLKDSIDTIVQWAERSPTIQANVQQQVDTIMLEPQSMGVTVVPMQNAVQSITNAFALPGRVAELADALKFYVVTASTWIWFALNTLAYKLYIAAAELVQIIASLPRTARRRFASVQELSYILQTKDLRELAFIEWKLSFKLFAKQLQNWAASLVHLGKQYYLAVMVVGALITTAISNIVGGSASFLQTASSRHALATAVPVYGVGSSNLLSRDVINLRQTAPRSFIVEHEVQNGETVAYLASLYNVSPETITFNNNLNGDELSAGSKVYVPPLNAYILIANTDTNATDVARVYKIDKNDLITYNPEFAITGSEDIAKGKVVMVPVSDFQLVKQYQEDEANRLKEEERKAQAAQFRAQALAGASYRKLDFLDSNRVAELNFGLPIAEQFNAATTYYGHINNAVDFGTGDSNPDAYSVADGVVVEVKSGCADFPSACFTGGNGDNSFYGNYITVDHGNGYKSRYAHLRSVYLNVGDKVSKGQPVGVISWSGNSFGKHLHFEIIKDGYGVFPPYVIPAIRMR